MMELQGGISLEDARCCLPQSSQMSDQPYRGHLPLTVGFDEIPQAPTPLYFYLLPLKTATSPNQLQLNNTHHSSLRILGQWKECQATRANDIMQSPWDA